MSVLPIGLRVIKNVTLPLSKWKNETPKFLQFKGEIFLGKQLADAKLDADGKAQKPAHLANVVDLETGEEMQVICASVLKATLEEEYPAGAYVEKAFMLTQHRDTQKKYNTYSIAELAFEADGFEVADAEVAKPTPKAAKA